MPANISRLSQMQANFQQKQLQEKEQKLLSLFENHQDKYLQKLEDQQQSRTSSAENQSLQMSSGKVRQLFEERRKLNTNTSKSSQNGWDKSHPLKPIKNKTNSKPGLDSLNKLLASHNKETINSTNMISPSKENTQESIGNGIFGKLPNIGGELLSAQKPKETSQKLYTTNMANTKPTTVNTVTKSMANVKITSAKKTTPKPPTKTSSVTPQAPPRSRQVTTPAPPLRKSTTTKVTSTPSVAPGLRSKSPLKRFPAPPTDPNLEQCKQCGRNFAKDRIEAHQKICAKTAKKKRKVFDPVKHRLKGTEAESFFSKAKPSPPASAKKTKNNWRKKHEEFIANIRAAKEAQDFIKKGGNVRDLPPPPPMDTSHLIPCPHCGRKFSEGAAERHIPKCVNMRHNKTTPARNQNKMGVRR